MINDVKLSCCAVFMLIIAVIIHVLMTEDGLADEVFRLPDRGAHIVHSAAEIYVSPDFLGRRLAPIPREHGNRSPLGSPAIAEWQMPKLLQGMCLRYARNFI